MPITFPEPDQPLNFNVILGYGDVGIGQIVDENYKGIGFVQLKQSFKAGEQIPQDQQEGKDTIRVNLLLRNQRGLADLRRIVSILEKENGLGGQSMMDKITNSYLSTIGDKEHEIEKLNYELKQAQARIAELEANLPK